MNTFDSTLFRTIAAASTWSNSEELEWFDSILAGRIVLDDYSTEQANAYTDGVLAGLATASKLASAQMPQGQYDRFNEYSLMKNLRKAVEARGGDWRHL